jgi:hypothetical protein
MALAAAVAVASAGCSPDAAPEAEAALAPGAAAIPERYLERVDGGG